MICVSPQPFTHVRFSHLWFEATVLGFWHTASSRCVSGLCILHMCVLELLTVTVLRACLLSEALCRLHMCVLELLTLTVLRACLLSEALGNSHFSNLDCTTLTHSLRVDLRHSRAIRSSPLRAPLLTLVAGPCPGGSTYTSLYHTFVSHLSSLPRGGVPPPDSEIWHVSPAY